MNKVVFVLPAVSIQGWDLDEIWTYHRGYSRMLITAIKN